MKLYALYFYSTSHNNEGNLSGCDFVSRYILLTTFLYLNLSIYQFIHLFIRSLIYPSIHLSIILNFLSISQSYIFQNPSITQKPFLSESQPSSDIEATPTDSKEFSWQLGADGFSLAKVKFNVPTRSSSKR